jgi:hypothetical protein
MKQIQSFIGGAAVVLTLMSAVPAVAQAQSGAVSEQPKKLSAHVSVVLQGQPGAQSNVGIVVGRKATLVIDPRTARSSPVSLGSSRHPEPRSTWPPRIFIPST